VLALMNRKFRIALTVTVLCGIGACASGPPKSEAQQAADTALAGRVEKALNSDQELYARHIIVRADDGVVRLSGFVWEPPDIESAERIAGSVDGVVKVVNALELQRNGVDNSAVSR
jgi:osmotically-inducible protein OsmY